MISAGAEDITGRLSAEARRSVQKRNWAHVRACASEILEHSSQSAEGLFLLGLAEKAGNRSDEAIRLFSAALDDDRGRYDAAVELAGELVRRGDYGSAVELLDSHKALMQSSPRYLDLAGTLYNRAGLADRALKLHQQAINLQPGADSIRAHVAQSSVFAGELEAARSIYLDLLERHPGHQPFHYELSRLGAARNEDHIEQMEALLKNSGLQPQQNIYLYYALGKELEDLQRWDEAFHYYKLAGDTVRAGSNYDVKSDVSAIDTVIRECRSDWLGNQQPSPGQRDNVPIFVVGLPRTGTTLTERILASHSEVSTIGETFFLPLSVKAESGVNTGDLFAGSIISGAVGADAGRIAERYMSAIAYLLEDNVRFVEKYPENVFNLGFIARAFPESPIICLDRHPLDACFALYKQSFFRYAYSLDDLGHLYLAYARLMNHWRAVLGDRLFELRYEDLVSDQECETRRLLDHIGVGFEESCLHFERNSTASNTASTVQIREKMHTRSVGRWRQFESHLAPLKTLLEDAGIDTGR